MNFAAALAAAVRLVAAAVAAVANYFRDRQLVQAGEDHARAEQSEAALEAAERANATRDAVARLDDDALDERLRGARKRP